MTAVVDGGRSYSSLVREGAVHSAIFTDESIFEDEMERIFYKYWMYVAHESEIPEPGDYCTKWVGRQHIVLTRDDEGEIRAFFNRCRHRGTTVCRQSSGTGEFFRCPYHGWTYNNRGRLIGVPYPSRYGPEFHRDELGLVPVAKLDAYRGFIFVCLSSDSPPLTDHLGKAAHYIDLFVGASPSGKVELRAGSSKALFRGNWKFVGMDGYHVNFTHKTVLDLQQRRQGSSYMRGFNNTDKAPNQTWDLGGGHCRLDLSHTDKVEVGKASSSSIAADIPDTPGGHSYLEAMKAACGSIEKAEDVIRRARDVHVHVWPNLQLIGGQVRVVRPLSASATEVIGYPAMLADVPDEINVRRLRAYEWFNGVAGFGSPDDTEVFERNQVGLYCDKEPWLVLTRGMGLAEELPDGSVVGNITDEVTQRSQMRQWARAMG